MAKKKMLEYQGKMYTLQELSDMYGVPVVTINNRIRNGWNVEPAIKTPKESVKSASSGIPDEFANGNIVRAIFTSPVPSVFAHMQPKLFKEYVVEARACVRAAPCFMITLENGSRLIVYPEEFQITSVTPPARDGIAFGFVSGVEKARELLGERSCVPNPAIQSSICRDNSGTPDESSMRFCFQLTKQLLPTGRYGIRHS